MGADKARHVRDTGAEVLVRRRQLVPDAHRRAAVARSGPACGVMHLAEMLAATERTA